MHFRSTLEQQCETPLTCPSHVKRELSMQVQVHFGQAGYCLRRKQYSITAMLLACYASLCNEAAEHSPGSSTLACRQTKAVSTLSDPLNCFCIQNMQSHTHCTTAQLPQQRFDTVRLNSQEPQYASSQKVCLTHNHSSCTPSVYTCWMFQSPKHVN